MIEHLSNIQVDGTQLSPGEISPADLPQSLRPFLKWPGGKRWLIEQYPEVLPTEFRNYYEPFIGGGSVFFHLQPSTGTISDINPDLINVYRAIRDSWEEVWNGLCLLQRAHTRSFYYHARTLIPNDPIERAVRFIYLNRTCFNGIYRVNKLGHFNVPVGTKTSIIMDGDNFAEISRSLKNISIRQCDFYKTIEKAGEGDFVFIDPPYTVQHNTNGFIKYNEVMFSWEDQLRLRNVAGKAKSRGAKVLILNAAHKSIRDLYQGFGTTRELSRRSVISGNNASRGLFSELAITTYA